MFTLDAYDGNSGYTMEFDDLQVAIGHAEYRWAHKTPAERRRYTSRRLGGHYHVTDADGRIVWEAGV